MAADTDEMVEHKENIARTLALSDGVFAVAITLLVLDIRVPNGVTQGHLLAALLQLTPAVRSYIISFLVIGGYWNVHRSMFRTIRRFDGRLSWLNLFFLLSIAFLPVPTSLLDRYDAVVSVVFYALSMSITGMLSFLLWYYASYDHRLVDESLDERRIFHDIIASLIAPLVFLLSTGLAFVTIFAPTLPGPDLAELSWLLIWALSLLHDRRYRRNSSNNA